MVLCLELDVSSFFIQRRLWGPQPVFSAWPTADARVVQVVVKFSSGLRDGLHSLPMNMSRELPSQRQNWGAPWGGPLKVHNSKLMVKMWHFRGKQRSIISSSPTGYCSSIHFYFNIFSLCALVGKTFTGLCSNFTGLFCCGAQCALKTIQWILHFIYYISHVFIHSFHLSLLIPNHIYSNCFMVIVW